MSIILLISSGIYELIAIPYIDSIGTLGLSYFTFKEGKECFEKQIVKNIVHAIKATIGNKTTCFAFLFFIFESVICTFIQIPR
tara:strand:- start:77501 stop:77749 length:249 start_codon:yes stop_codon:yes gene_type:complete